MAIIKISNLSKNYGKHRVLDNISLTIEENKIYGLLGRNGAGKTTLLNIISNRIFQSEGSVKIDDEDVIENSNVTGKIYYMTEQDLYPESMKIKELQRSLEAHEHRLNDRNTNKTTIQALQAQSSKAKGIDQTKS